MTKVTRTKDIAAELSIKAFNDSGNGEVEGYASVFGNIDHVGDVIERGSFAKTIQQNRGKIRFLWQHDRYEPIGAITELREDEKGLYFRAEFADTVEGQKARNLLKMEGAMGGFSIGYQVLQEVRDEQPDGRSINRIKEVRLLEISAVTFPCNEEAVVLGVKSAPADGLSDEEAQLVEQFKAFLLSQRSKDAPEASSEAPTGDTGPVVAVDLTDFVEGVKLGIEAATEFAQAIDATPSEDEKSDEADIASLKDALDHLQLVKCLLNAESTLKSLRK